MGNQLAQTEVDRIVREALEFWEIPGAAIAIVQDGAVTCSGHGVKDLRTGEAVTPRTLFAIASVTCPHAIGAPGAAPIMATK